ncbi:hypothetical protein HYFRA_00004434 [Hymenoscyphus fraxineus]|uniref:Uncharacterized protein n=1 Tax=Hymenoscyphus fraxineus TaxID=746836 RepID=A0A9N9KUI6_9HELO|nr:hypothetical protein HYFRA_00004434 [Hymenoscyphus fraxineus]
MTDSNGWLLVYTPKEIRTILSTCDRLHDLRCTIPTIRDQKFYVTCDVYILLDIDNSNRQRLPGCGLAVTVESVKMQMKFCGSHGIY